MNVAARYQMVKEHILSHIASGELTPGMRIPSENELVAALGISRMTVNRALRELAQEGRISRLAGVGSFVADQPAEAAVLQVPSIRDWIAARGQTHSWRVVERSEFTARPELARLYDLPAGTRFAFALLVHSADGTPIQAEERYVNLEIAERFADADIAATLPSDLLAPFQARGTRRLRAEAVKPASRIAGLLELPTQDPCLAVTERLEVRGAVASIARLFHPGTRFDLQSTP